MKRRSRDHVEVELTGGVARVFLNRVEVHNAFNASMIQELLQVFDDLQAEADLRVVVLGGHGASFCAGADLEWMRQTSEYSEHRNAEDAKRLATLFGVVDACPVPVVGQVQGAAIGGGTGLVACCDIAVTTKDTRFGFSEVRLGLAPAVISPFLIDKIGARHARELFVTGARFRGERALQIGLVNHCVEDVASLSETVHKMVQNILKGGPEAVRACKMIARTVGQMERVEAIERTAEIIAGLRVSDEGQEGMTSFLERRPPAWSRSKGGKS